jgi:hypothetical protein
MLNLTVTQQSALTVAYVDAAGNPAIVDGDPVWSVTDPAIVELTAGATPFEIVARATGVIGTAQVSVTADADLGEGVRSLVTTLDVTVVAGEAVAGNISTAPAEEQPAPVDPAEAPTGPDPIDPVV